SSLARSSRLRCACERPLPPRLMWKFSIDIAERNGALLRRRLCSAERLSERAMARALDFLKTPRSRSRALLVRMTRADHCFAINDAEQWLCRCELVPLGVDGCRSCCRDSDDVTEAR